MDLKDYGLGNITDWASLIFPIVYPGSEPFTHEQLMGWEELKAGSPIGYVFVIDRKFERRGQVSEWKLPAGHRKSKPDEPGGEVDRTPLDTAIRELHGETGIQLPSDAFTYVGKYLHPRGDHWKCLFAAKMTEVDRDWLNNHHKENEGEEPKFFTPDEFYALVRDNKFMREHYEKLVEYVLILPLGRDKRSA